MRAPPPAPSATRRSPRLAAVALGLLLVPAAAGASPLSPHAGAVGAGSIASPRLPAALSPSTGELPRWGAIYATPSAIGFGLTVGRADRQEARRAAERECRSAGLSTDGPAARCRLLAEFAERCAAVAQGIEHRPPQGRGARRAPPGYVVTSVAAGAGRTLDEAETAAIEACEEAGRRGFCLIAASACAPR